MIPIYKPSIKRKEMDALLSTLVSDYIEAGNENIDFLKALSKFFSLEPGALLRDYSTAISIALKALDLGRGSKVIISPLSPSVYIRELEKLSITAVYLDVDITSACMKSDEILEICESDIDGLILYSPNGIRPDYSRLSQLNIPVIEDITTTAGTDFEENWTPDIAILRMELMDTITSGEGCGIFSGNKKFLSVLKSVITDLPVTSFLLNMHAAMGMKQLDSIDHFIERRKEIGSVFESSILKGNHKTFHSPDDFDRNYPTFHVILNSPFKEISRYARKNGVMVEMAFSDSAMAVDPSVSETCPIANSLNMRTASFPLYPGLGSKNTLSIARVLSTLP
jgi:perosamine synthetase